MTPNILPVGTTLTKLINPSLVAKRLLTEPDTFATVLLTIAVDVFGTDCLHDPDDPGRGPWHPATFRSMLTEHFGVAIPNLSIDKLMAAVTIVTTDMFFKNVDRFIALANVLAGSEFSPEQFDKADTAECAWAITEALILDPPDSDDHEPFCDDIRRYLGAVLRDEGYISPPDVLKIAIEGDFSDRVRYNFSDDPVMFSGIYKAQQDKTKEIEGVIHDSLILLAEQLQSLRLQNGSTAELEKNIRGMLKKTEPANVTGPEHVFD